MVRLHDPGKLPRSNHRSPRFFDWNIAVNDAVADDHKIGTRSFPARFSGKCPCGEEYKAGDMVHFINRQALAHEGCDGTDVSPPSEAIEVMAMGPAQVAKVRSRLCPTCFTEKLPSGRCGNCDV